MVGMMDPREGDVICDPASGSGGFLIRFFEIVREQIAAIEAEREAAKKLAQDIAREVEDLILGTRRLDDRTP
jgi:type I restriction-modification system DNA methylase subunit